jgi:protein-tyrosine phosphatase
MAEGMFKKLVKDSGLENNFLIESRATSTWEEGNPPHIETNKILKRIGINLENKKSTIISSKDFEYFDYIIGMDHENMKYLINHAKEFQNKLYLLRDIDEATLGQIVPDPYFNGKYEETYQLLNESLKLWLDKLKNA